MALRLNEDANDAACTLPLFRKARRVEPVLSYEQARLDQIIPNAMPPSGSPRDGLILPGGIGLVLYESASEELAFDWMKWGETADPAKARPCLDATVSVTELSQGARAVRKLTRQRCVIPLTRY